jgi:hypothetical protein
VKYKGLWSLEEVEMFAVEVNNLGQLYAVYRAVDDDMSVIEGLT